MKQGKESLVLGKILQEIAPRIGARIFLEPEWELAGQIVFKSGRKSYFKYNTLDLNPVGASDIAKDKDYANYFMNSMGYPVVPRSKTFFSKQWAHAIGVTRRGIDDAYAYALKIGFPVIVKPNSGSQGSDVALVHTKREFYRAVRAVFGSDRIVLVQKPVRGKDYRLVVLDNEVISAYERIPLNVTGDGRSTVMQLLRKKQRQFKLEKRDTRLNFADPRIVECLQRQNLTFASVLEKAALVYLLSNANLSTGGDSIDVTTTVHPEFAARAIALTRDMGLRLCGVDFMVEGDITQLPHTFWVLEINAAPGLDHYARSGSVQEEIVRGLYLKVMKSLDR